MIIEILMVNNYFSRFITADFTVCIKYMKNISYRILYHTWLYFVVSKYQDDTRMGPWIRKLCLWLQLYRVCMTCIMSPRGDFILYLPWLILWRFFLVFRGFRLFAIATLTAQIYFALSTNNIVITKNAEDNKTTGCRIYQSRGWKKTRILCRSGGFACKKREYICLPSGAEATLFESTSAVRFSRRVFNTSFRDLGKDRCSEYPWISF